MTSPSRVSPGVLEAAPFWNVKTAILLIVERMERQGECSICHAEVCRGVPHAMNCEVGTLKLAAAIDLGSAALALGDPGAPPPLSEEEHKRRIVLALKAYQHEFNRAGPTSLGLTYEGQAEYMFRAGIRASLPPRAAPSNRKAEP